MHDKSCTQDYNLKLHCGESVTDLMIMKHIRPQNSIIVLIFMFFTLLCYTYGARIQLSCEQIRAFVDGHNKLRQRVSHRKVPGQPAATNMKFMVWDEELAKKAADWAEKNQFAHNPDRSIGSQRWDLVGENVFQSTYTSNIDIDVAPNIEEALNGWFNEHLNYGFEPFSLDTVKPIGHYTQMVWANSNHVGCGISQRKQHNTTYTLFVCDYGPTGNYLGEVPYSATADKLGYLRCATGACNKPYGNYC